MHEQFVNNLRSYGIGDLLSEAAEAQGEIVARVREKGGTGKLTIEISYKLENIVDIKVSSKVKVKFPESKIRSVNMFPDENCDLHEENPAQMNFDNVQRIEVKPKKINQA